MVKVGSWGRLCHPEHKVRVISCPDEAKTLLAGAASVIAYGNGRSYGDVCLNPGGELIKTRALDNLISFDESSGILTCEAGILFRDIQRLFVPKGWMLPVPPGTQLITVGGAIANDIHGKNHHRAGSFGNAVCRLKLVRSDGSTIECGSDHNQEWFSATVGGVGLTGIIIEAAIQCKRVKGPWIDAETIPYETLEDFFALSDSSEAEWEHTVSWIDCISDGGGRGIFMRGNHSASDKKISRPGLKLAVPFTPPVSLINNISLRAFNATYFHLQKRKAGRRLVPYESFFYPLDNVAEWNRAYGPKGFFQYQSVIPRKDGLEATRAMLHEISRSGTGSFLAVLKTFGGMQPVGMLSFPQPGVTLALDFPNQGKRTDALFERLDGIVREAGGRLYPAKDARMPRDLFEAGYPRLNEFLGYRDPVLSSQFSRRVTGF